MDRQDPCARQNLTPAFSLCHFFVQVPQALQLLLVHAKGGTDFILEMD